jgi:hypothetical protein
MKEIEIFNIPLDLDINVRVYTEFVSIGRREKQ